MREQRIDRNARERVFRRRVLFDDADAIDDDIWAHAGETANDAVKVLSRHAADGARRIEDAEPGVNGRRATKSRITIESSGKWNYCSQ